MKYRAEIDGLRALAVVPVILFHAGFELFSGGFIGVDIFFVISGYLITTILIDDIENKKFSIINFYERRARRILPALYFVMLVCIPFAWMWMPPDQMKDFSQSLVAVSLFVSNILFWQESGYFEVTSEEKPLLHTWSLAVEEQYYLLFPIFLILTWRFGKLRVFWMIISMATISLLFSEWGWRNKANANFYLAPTRAWELLAGSIAAFIVQRNGVRKNDFLALIGLALIIISLFAYDKNTPFPSVYALIPVTGAFLLILYGNKETMIARLLSTRLFVGIGLISYSAYLWHQPLFAFARVRSTNEPSHLLMGLLVLGSLALAFLSWRYIEKPFRKKGKVNRKKIFVYASTGLVLFSIFGLIGHKNNGFAARLQPEFNVIHTTSMEQFENSIRDCWTKIEENPSIESGCILGAKKIDPSFAILGDSHAAMLLSEIDRIALKQGISGVSLTARSCPPVKNIKRVSTNREECSLVRNEIFNEDNIARLPENIIVMARWPLLIERERYTNSSGYLERGENYIWEFIDPKYDDYVKNMQHEIRESLEYFLEHGKRLIIVYPSPEMGWLVPNYLVKTIFKGNKITRKTGSTTYESFISRTKTSYEVLNKVGNEKNIFRIYPSDYSCEEEVCLAHLDLQPLYFDDDHLTGLGARPIAESIILSLLDK